MPTAFGGSTRPGLSGPASSLRETSGPTTLTVGEVADGEFLKRDGATVVGATVDSGGIDELTGEVTAGPGTGSQAATIAAGAVTNAKRADMAEATISGRAAGAGTGVPTDLSANQASTILDGATDPFLRTSAGGGGGITQLTADVTAGPGSGSQAATIATGVVTNAKLADMAAGTYKMRVTGSTGVPEDATATQATAGLNVMVGDSGSGGTKGLAPAPGAGDAAANKFLRADGTYAVPGGVGGGIDQLTGDVTAGPGSGSQAATIANNAVTNAKLDDMAALTAKVRAANSSGDPSDLALTDGHAAKRVGTAIVSGGFGPASRSVLTSGTGATYTVPAGVYRLIVHVQGPGGGGGGGDQGTNQSGIAAGGGSGGYANKLYAVTPGDTFTYTVGLGGAGGTAGNNAGSNGTANTVFDSGGSPVTGALGVGGGSLAAGTSLVSTTAGAGGTATGGDWNIAGQKGGAGTRYSVNVLQPGNGADSFLGIGGPVVSSGAGLAGTGYGSGGSGGLAYQNTADVAGGDGAPGVIIVEEFT